MTQSNTKLFENQTVYCGLDVHKKQWTVCVIHCGREAAYFVTPPNPVAFAKTIFNKYPGADIYSAYEAGFSGFEDHRVLVTLGINNIVINPADVPTMGKERSFKSDKIDCRKIARALAANNLECIYIPDCEQLRLRSVVRQETQFVRMIARIKNQIKSHLLFFSKPYFKSFSRCHLEKAATQAHSCGDYVLEIFIRQMQDLMISRKEIKNCEKKLIKEMHLTETMQILQTVPGIAFRSAVIILSELWDMKRFKSKAKLAAYVGLAPRVVGSGDREETVSTGNRKQKFLHYIFVEAAQRATRCDPKFAGMYGRLLLKGNTKQQAICAAAKKMLFVLRAMWLSNSPYECGVYEKQ